MLKTNSKFHVPVVTVSTRDYTKVLELLKSCFKRTISIKKSIERPKQNLDYLIEQSFQVINRIFFSSFEDEVQRTSYKQ